MPMAMLTVLSGHLGATGEWGRSLLVDSSSDILQYFQRTASQLSDVAIERIVDKSPLNHVGVLQELVVE